MTTAVPKPPKYYALEGIIGCGKTTVLSLLSKVPQLHCIPEPVEAFARYGSHNPLSLSYENPHINAAIAQMHILRASANFYHAELQRVRNDNPLCIVSERSILSPQVFIETNLERGLYSDFVHDYLVDELSYLSAEVRKPDFIIILDAPPDLCVERVKIRSRDGENMCTREFQATLRSVYLDMCKSWAIPYEIVKVTEEAEPISISMDVQNILSRKF